MEVDGVNKIVIEKPEILVRLFIILEQHSKLQLGLELTVVREAGEHLFKILLHQDKSTNSIKTVQLLLEVDTILIQTILPSGILMEISVVQSLFQLGRPIC